MYHNAHQQGTRNNSHSQDRDPITVVAVPAVTLVGSRLVVGDSSSTSTRSYTPLKVVGDGSFGTVWLCDWHGLLPPNTPLSPMQCGAGARPEWAGKRLVAVKRMKRRWEGGWDQCKTLKELEALRAIIPHPNVIPLYDFFLLPSSKELYFVFESMEGNLYQLIKSRKNRPLAGGLVSSIFGQVVSGLHHIHASGYFHRDMKPENLLVTTTGIADYLPVSPVVAANVQIEKDVVVIIKLADFGLARETTSRPPYTEYVSTRWYRAPEVLLHSREYSNPVDMWALGTIMAELVNLRPLFPGQGEIDQVHRVCQFLGDPSVEYGVNERGKPLGGGPWPRGVKLASKVGFTFPKHTPVPIESIFEPSVPASLVECISDLLKYDPDARLTSKECLEHRYLIDTAPPSQPPQLSISTSLLPPPIAPIPARNGRSPVVPSSALNSQSPRSVPPSHSHPGQFQNHNGKLHINGSAFPLHPSIPETGPQRVPFYQRAVENSTSVLPSNSDARRHIPADPVSHLRDTDMVGIDTESEIVFTNSQYTSSIYSASGEQINQPAWLQTSPQEHVWDTMDPAFGPQNGAHGMHIHHSPMVRTLPDDDLARSIDHDMIHDPTQSGHHVNGAHGKGGKFSSLGLSKKRGWGIGSMFGNHDKIPQQPPLAPVDELVASSSSTPSLKRTQSGSTDSHSLPDISPTGHPPPPMAMISAVERKKIKKEAERVAREAEKQRRLLVGQAQRKQAQAVMQNRSQVIQQAGEPADIEWIGFDRPIKGKQTMFPSTIAAAGGRYGAGESVQWLEEKRRLSENDHRHKARRRDLDDDHSMSSSDLQSISRMSMISFLTVDSDPGPPRPVRHRPSAYAISRATSYSSLRPPPSGRALSPSGRSSTSIEGQLVHEFSALDTFGSQAGSPPPPIRELSLSPTMHNPSWPDLNDGPYPSQLPTPNVLLRKNAPSHLHLPPLSSFDNVQQLRVPGSSHEYTTGSSNPSSPGLSSPAINPMFQVPSHHSLQQTKISQTLPPISQLASVIEQPHESSTILPPIQDNAISDPPG